MEGLSEYGSRHRLEKAAHLISGQKMCSRAGLPWPVAEQLRLSELWPSLGPTELVGLATHGEVEWDGVLHYVLTNGSLAEL